MVGWMMLLLLLSLSAPVSAATRFAAPADVGAGNCTDASNACDLQQAMTAAACGDTIQLANGTYTSTYSTSANANTCTGPSGNGKITMRAANQHLAILDGTSPCSTSTGVTLQKPWWVVQDLKLTDHGRAFFITAANVEVAHNVIDHFMVEGVQVNNTTGANVHHNVIAHADPTCQASGNGFGFILNNNADQNTIADNIIVGTGDNGYQYGTKNGYGGHGTFNSDQNTIQGNLFLANQGKGTFRFLSFESGETANNNLLRDNAALWSESGGFDSGDCTDDSNQFLNNIAYGNYYQQGLGTKGNNSTFDWGHHIFRHNLTYGTAFSLANNVLGIGTGGSPCTVSREKRNLTWQDNLVISDATLATSGANWRLMDVRNEGNGVFTTKSHNLYWAPSGTDTSWVNGYTYAGTDIHTAGSGGQPIFANPSAGDFRLCTAAGVPHASCSGASPGVGAASDSTDIGITYNSHLKLSWMAEAFGLATQERTGLTAATSITPFTVEANRVYQMWFYVPNSPCSNSAETFTIEGVGLDRDIPSLVSQSAIQPGGPARYITLGRHKSTDTSLTVTWETTNCVERVFIRALPTADEAYTWIASAVGGPIQPPTNLRVVSP